MAARRRIDGDLAAPSRARVRSLALLGAACLAVLPARAADAIAWWDTPRRGANCQRHGVDPAYWEAAKAAGLDFIRLLPDAWPARGRDFLIGDASCFVTLEEADVTVLVHALDDAERAGVKVVLGMISLPGARWKQLNGDRDDARLWRDAAFQEQAAAFWRQLAGRLRGHPAIVAYNPLNEPHPERSFGFEEPGAPGYEDWRRRAKGTPADVDAFNRRLVAAIRASDPVTPILLDGPFYASPEGLSLLEPVEDARTLYAFHFYEPWEYTTFRVNKRRFAYPGRMPCGPDEKTAEWTIDSLRARVVPTVRWAAGHGIPRSRMVAAEFGVSRRVEGALAYLTDLVRVLDESAGHRAFYAFRSDGAWTDLDYELGFEPVDPRIWAAEERGEDTERFKRRHDNPLWRALWPSPEPPPEPPTGR
jgi:endoglucanase